MNSQDNNKNQYIIVFQKPEWIRDYKWYKYKIHGQWESSLTILNKIQAAVLSNWLYEGIK